ncbi:helix-turn-helix domain-containing protein, partial [Balneolaceae bacterium ANBcel3]|nr:helix-turn-helix domain-containing protein [Balneolaceae bacterium ANBcel3]
YDIMNSVHPDRTNGSSHMISIKNMVCDRCIMAVEEILRSQGYRPVKITLGHAEIIPVPDEQGLLRIQEALTAKGFEFAVDPKEKLVAKIKGELILYVQKTEKEEKLPLLSEYLATRLHRSYPSLSRSFTAIEGTTIEKYMIRLRIERVKELLELDKLTLAEIAWKLGYSSVQHLSAQFKQITGESFSSYKEKSLSERKKRDAL